jgi:hypothetical protein
MEKHTISALIVAGAAVIGSVFQGLVLRAAKRKRESRGAGSSGPPNESDRSQDADGR